jgi:hypothetical protein
VFSGSDEDPAPAARPSGLIWQAPDAAVATGGRRWAVELAVGLAATTVRAAAAAVRAAMQTFTSPCAPGPDS